MRIPDRGSTTGEASWTDRTRSGRAARSKTPGAFLNNACVGPVGARPRDGPSNGERSESIPPPPDATFLHRARISPHPGPLPKGRGESSRHGLPLTLALSQRGEGKVRAMVCPSPWPSPQREEGKVRATVCPLPWPSPRREEGKVRATVCPSPWPSPQRGEGKVRATVCPYSSTIRAYSSLKKSTSARTEGSKPRREG